MAGAENNVCKDNVKTYPNSLYPTQFAKTPPQASMSSKFGYAGSSLLPKVTLTDKNRLAWAILDSGASSHFLLTDAPVESKVIAKNPIEIRLPDGNEVKSSHDAILDLPQLPKIG